MIFLKAILALFPYSFYRGPDPLNHVCNGGKSKRSFTCKGNFWLGFTITVRLFWKSHQGNPQESKKPRIHKIICRFWRIYRQRNAILTWAWGILPSTWSWRSWICRIYCLFWIRTGRRRSMYLSTWSNLCIFRFAFFFSWIESWIMTDMTLLKFVLFSESWTTHYSSVMHNH